MPVARITVQKHVVAMSGNPCVPVDAMAIVGSYNRILSCPCWDDFILGFFKKMK